MTNVCVDAIGHKFAFCPCIFDQPKNIKMSPTPMSKAAVCEQIIKLRHFPAIIIPISIHFAFAVFLGMILHMVQASLGGRKPLSRSELETTVTELSAMAAAASIGLRKP